MMKRPIIVRVWFIWVGIYGLNIGLGWRAPSYDWDIVLGPDGILIATSEK